MIGSCPPEWLVRVDFHGVEAWMSNPVYSGSSVLGIKFASLKRAVEICWGNPVPRQGEALWGKVPRTLAGSQWVQVSWTVRDCPSTSHFQVGGSSLPLLSHQALGADDADHVGLPATFRPASTPPKQGRDDVFESTEHHMNMRNTSRLTRTLVPAAALTALMALAACSGEPTPRRRRPRLAPRRRLRPHFRLPPPRRARLPLPYRRRLSPKDRHVQRCRLLSWMSTGTR